IGSQEVGGKCSTKIAKITKAVVEMANTLNLRMDEDDTEELLEVVPEELTNEEFLELEQECIAEEEGRRRLRRGEQFGAQKEAGWSAGGARSPSPPFSQSPAQAQPGGGGGNRARGSLAGASGGKGGANSDPRTGWSETPAARGARESGGCPGKRGELSMGKKWRDAAEVERGCSDREDGAESRRRSRSASRGRFAESWKRLSSKQGSTKRSGLPSQQTPVLQPGNLWNRF
ncbi:PREDICTED: homeobox protein engrailed-2-like, partial [Hipposideros armiger]|uniref:Homeobox protein engrailed-2-like n=1 Tax=Hipposideros armiger TaxID=186990 RepID=A0A8B7QQ05_HIPAR